MTKAYERLDGIENRDCMHALKALTLKSGAYLLSFVMPVLWRVPAEQPQCNHDPKSPSIDLQVSKCQEDSTKATLLSIQSEGAHASAASSAIPASFSLAKQVVII